MATRYSRLRRLAKLAVVPASLTTLYFAYTRKSISSFTENLPSEYRYRVYSDKAPIPASEIPTRLDCLDRLKSGEEFDVLVIGGGCTGSGVALDAVTRGLNVALVERDDFSSGTSSRSTKLIHGGIRYLEKAFKNLDIKQLNLVIDALGERKHLLGISPNLAYDVPIIVPLYYKYPEFLFYAPYFWVGLKMYDWFAGSKGTLKSSFYMGQRETMEKFPMLNQQGLKGAIVYYDGMHNDARMNLNIALTAANKGAAVTNYVEVKEFLKNDKGKINGAILKDNITGDEFKVNCKAVINATGCYTDSTRKMENRKAENIITPSAGVHIVLPSTYCPRNAGMVIPNTDDNRVLFLLPWEGSTIAGTTDTSCDLKKLPSPTSSEVGFIIKELRKFLKSDLNIKDINASWSGIRPLAKDITSKSTASISRDHVIEVTEGGLISISGGKWTTYRKMSEDVVDRLLQENKSITPKNGCVTKQVPLVGASGWSVGVKEELKQRGLTEEVAEHLSHNYGYLAYKVADIGKQTGYDSIIATGYPFIEAEVIFGIRHEFAMSLVDVIARRMRLAFLNSEVTNKAVPRILEIMAKEKKWDSKKRVEEYHKAAQFMDTMNVQTTKRYNWEAEESAEATIEKIEKAFGKCPLSKKDVITIKHAFKKQKQEQLTEESFAKVVEQLCVKSVEMKKHLFKVKSDVEKRNNKYMTPEELVFSLSGYIISEE